MLPRLLVGFCLVCGCLYAAVCVPAANDPDAVVHGPFRVQPFGGEARPRRSGSLQSRRDTLQGTTQLTYLWRDPHTMGIVKWKGDSAVIDPRVRPRQLSLTVKINRKRVKEVMESFGVPESWFTVRARTKAELKRKKSELIAKFAARGFTLGPAGCRPDHSWIIDKSTDDLTDLARRLSTITLRKGYATQRQHLAILASFAQAMEFRAPEPVRLNEAGERVKTGGVTMPLETLYNGYGDCDTKSLLFASILANFPNQRAIFVMGNGHLFVGIRAIPRLNDHYMDIRGIKYVLLEMSTPWPLGRIPQKRWKGCRRNQFRVARVVSTSGRSTLSGTDSGIDRRPASRPTRHNLR